MNKTLTLKNITIDGNLSREKSIDGASIVLGQSGNTSYATLIIQDGTFITKGYRTSGGGTIRIYHAKIEMYGGRISENYGHSSAFGIYTTGDLKAYLYGGEISNNYSLSVTNTMSVISEIVVGGKFAFKDNNSITDDTLGLNLKLESLNKTNLQIREDFDGYILVDDSAPERFKVIKAIYLGDNVNGDIKAFSIQPQQNLNLYARVVKEKDLQNFKNLDIKPVIGDVIWDYIYTAYELFKSPTEVSTGELRQYAIIDGQVSGTIYNSVTLPKLDGINYCIDEIVAGEAYTWNETSYGDYEFIVINFTPSFEGNITNIEPTIVTYDDGEFVVPISPEGVTVTEFTFKDGDQG